MQNDSKLMQLAQIVAATNESHMILRRRSTVTRMLDSECQPRVMSSGASWLWQAGLLHRLT